jgi:hypothetical protein
VDFHLEHGLRLHTEPEHKNLYSWAINEIDAQGRQIGHDQILWPWRLYFTATSCALRDNIEMNRRLQMEETTPAPYDVVQSQVITMQLKPGRPRHGRSFQETTFSMFGTDRVIKSFQVDIHPIADPNEQEQCRAWGSVSNTTEIDFRDETFEDCITFSLYVRPETFGRYAAKIAYGLLNDIVLSVGLVDGFYSEWSPSISTDNVKVLTGHRDEQKIALPPGGQFEPPRLGRVGEANLFINRRLDEFDKRTAEPETVEDMTDLGTQQAADTQTPALADPLLLQMLGSLRRVAWFAVSLLALILILMLLRQGNGLEACPWMGRKRSGMW